MNNTKYVNHKATGVGNTRNGSHVGKVLLAIHKELEKERNKKGGVK